MAGDDKIGMTEKVGVIKTSIFDDPPKFLKAVYPELIEIVEQIDRIEANQKKMLDQLERIEQSLYKHDALEQMRVENIEKLFSVDVRTMEKMLDIQKQVDEMSMR